MKKLFFLLVLAAIVLLGSCTRSYTCECIFTTTGGVKDTTYPATSASTEAIAKTNCQNMSNTSLTGTVDSCFLR